ncbi:UNVERIFIED_CONTAM: hypothetical protein FKN15_061266 [Acipenser sinensis]
MYSAAAGMLKDGCCVLQVHTWKHVIDELRSGVSLRKSEEHQNTSSFLQVDLSPHEKLMNDIRYRQYTLRKVQTVDNLQRLSSPHDVVLNFVRSNPRLKPASDRRLKSLPKEEASLHQLLMTEIRSAGKLRPLVSWRRRRAACQGTEDCKSFESSDLMHSAELPSSCTDVKFFPMLSSSPQDLQNGVSDQRRRSKSFDSSFGLNKKDFHDDCQPPTIADVMKLRQAECRQYSGYGSSRNRRMCSNCCKKSVHFTWHNTCAFCNRVVCPECCMEMLLPYKWCVHLPVSFFKKLVLMKDGDPICQTQETSTFWQERWDWDCSRIPLVLESRKPCKTAPQHRSAMQDWYSNDICVGCQELLVEIDSGSRTNDSHKHKDKHKDREHKHKDHKKDKEREKSKHSNSEHKDSSEKKNKDKDKVKHKGGSSEKHKDKHKDKRKDEKSKSSSGETKIKKEKENGFASPPHIKAEPESNHCLSPKHKKSLKRERDDDE